MYMCAWVADAIRDWRTYVQHVKVCIGCTVCTVCTWYFDLSTQYSCLVNRLWSDMVLLTNRVGPRAQDKIQLLFCMVPCSSLFTVVPQYTKNIKYNSEDFFIESERNKISLFHSWTSMVLMLFWVLILQIQF